MRLTLSILAGLTFISVLTGCGTAGEVKDGKKAFELEQYLTAADMLREELSNTNDPAKQAEITFLIAECYRHSNLTLEAETWYLDAADRGYGMDAEFWYGATLKRNEKYQLAIEKLTEYVKKYPEDKARGELELRGAELAVKWKGMKTMYEVSRLDIINTQYSDYSPTFFENKNLVITSSRDDAVGDDLYDRTGEKFSDLYLVAVSDDDHMEVPIPFPFEKLNTEYNEGTIAFDSSFNEMYFTRCFHEDKKVTDHCKIYQSNRSPAGVWSDPLEIKFFGDSVDAGHPRLFDKDSRMIFSSNAPGGFGGRDLYISERTASGWGSPVNAGPVINTARDEMFPYVHSDGTIFFASDGHVGMGGLDVFFSEKKEGNWVMPANLQAPVNTGADDFGLVFDEYEVLNQSGYFEATGYLSSSRAGGLGSDDVYKFMLRKPAYFELIVEVIRKDYDDPYNPQSAYKFVQLPDAEVTLSMINDEGFLEEVEKRKTDNEGKTMFNINPDTDYQVRAAKDTLTAGDQFKYLAKTEKISTKEIRTYRIKITLTIEIVLEPKRPNVPVNIPNIYYNFDKWDIRADAAKVLEQLAQMLRDNPGVVIEFGSHTDSRGSTSYNEKLSQRRADAVVKFLISKGIAKGRLVGVGHGESQLVNGCQDEMVCTEANHQSNRRSTFTIIGENFKLVSYTPEVIIVDPDMLKREQEEKEKEKEKKEKLPEDKPKEDGSGGG